MDALFETFKAQAEAVSAEVHRFATRRESVAFITALLQEQGCQDPARPGALCADGDLRGDFEAPGPSFSVDRQAAAQAGIGISRMDWAIAATGTLVQDSTAVEQRLVSSLPPIHVALVKTTRIVADMAELFQRIHPDQASYIAMITGPSRTADIERVLTIGVHGPERLIILCVDELERGNA
jgi:L-lactate dehydrogenase complex protein LldG